VRFLMKKAWPTFLDEDLRRENLIFFNIMIEIQTGRGCLSHSRSLKLFRY